MNKVIVNVEVSHLGKKASAPVFAHRDKNGKFVVSEAFVQNLANKIGYNPKVVTLKISEDLDEAA